jgi:hypothetical protein
VPFFYAVNGADDFGSNALAVPVLTAAGEVEDSDSYGGWLEVEFSSGAVSVAGGAAFVNIDNDTYANDPTQLKFYVHLQYKVHANFVIRPEIGYIDYDETVPAPMLVLPSRLACASSSCSKNRFNLNSRTQSWGRPLGPGPICEDHRH